MGSIVDDFAYISRAVHKSREADVRKMVEDYVNAGMFVAKYDVYPCGSRHVCSPPVYTTDEDYLVYCGIDLSPLLQQNGYVLEDTRDPRMPAAATGSTPTKGNGVADTTKFQSWRYGDINLIVTRDREFADRYILATRVCKKFNLLDKADRITLYTAILYSEYKS